MSNLYDNYKARCIGTFLKTGHSVQEAEDLTHDEFVHILSKNGNLDNSVAYLTTNVRFSATTERARRLIKENNLKQAYVDTLNEQVSPEQDLIEKDMRAKFYKALDTLPAKQAEEIRNLLNGEKVKYYPKYGIKKIKEMLKV